MTLPCARSGGLALVLGVGLAAAGCSTIPSRQGYVADEVLLSSVQPGVDNRDSVQATLGRPTFTGQFTERDWYYVSRRTRQLAFNNPKAVDQTVFPIRYDEAGKDRKSVVEGKSVSVSVDPGGRRVIQKKKKAPKH